MGNAQSSPPEDGPPSTSSGRPDTSSTERPASSGVAPQDSSQAQGSTPEKSPRNPTSTGADSSGENASTAESRVDSAVDVGDATVTAAAVPAAAVPADTAEQPKEGLVAERAAWFQATRTATAKKMAEKALEIQTYQSTPVLIDSTTNQTAQTTVRYKVHIDLYQGLKTSVKASLSTLTTSDDEDALREMRTIIRCPMDHGMYYLDAVVEMLAKDLEAHVIHVDSQDLADVAQYLGEFNEGRVKLEKALTQTHYVCHPAGESESEVSVYDSDYCPTSLAMTRQLNAFWDAILDSCAGPIGDAKADNDATSDAGSDSDDEDKTPKVKPHGTPLFIHLRDFKEVAASRFGKTVLESLDERLNERRERGQPALFIGSFCTARLLGEMRHPSAKHDSNNPLKPDGQIVDITPPANSLQRAVLSNDLFRWNLETNVRRLKHAVRALGNRTPAADDLFHPLTSWDTSLLPESLRKSLEKAVWPQSQVMKVAKLVCGLPTGQEVKLADLADLVRVKDSCDELNSSFAAAQPQAAGSTTAVDSDTESVGRDIDARLEALMENDSDVVKELLRGVTKPGTYNIHFSDVILDRGVKQSLRTLIKLSIERPQAYTYGVLKGNRIPGVLLYGPPGTGKTLLAKAMATESGCTTLEVSGAQVLQRYVGESEKIIAKIFEVAKALQPCVVFLDEADSVFTKRSDKGNSWERTMVNQFLHEWDSMAHGSENAFIVVATNRPQDIDDAILRRLPQRIHIGLPGLSDRLAILQHYLADERATDVDLVTVARYTARYSGSDLKNLCVQAATRAVQDELLGPSATEPGAPRPRRVLNNRHFALALQDIRPCVTNQMLLDLRKFDESGHMDPYSGMGRRQRTAKKVGRLFGRK
ncbi:AAA-domain-containing protein [Trichodelitschia bisporula]|uniref:AAA-domain-containing protein n=1 Tax=Trichodelitschia bisporula TaxID=703511 RepID=A0A6G1HJL1_9PEZI|nr:AAA-domain-containing protein [Trichodelitschia bisporula]